MNWRALRTIAIKDLKEVKQNRAAGIPAVIVPLFFLILLPLAIILLPGVFNLPMDSLLSEQGPVGMMRGKMPPTLAAELAGLNGLQTWIVLMTGFMLAPMFLILPLMLSSMVGADSFAGEKERKTLEALLYTPASDGELFLAKVLASVVPAIVFAWLGFLVYAVVVNMASWPAMGRVWFPTASWWPLMLWVTPATATLGMAVTVLISSRVSTFMEAYQLSGSLVVLVLALVAGQVTGVIYLSVGTALLIGLGIWAMDGLLLMLGVRTFARSELITRV